MDMVGTHLHLFNRDVILLRNIGKEPLHSLLDLLLARHRGGTWVTRPSDTAYRRRHGVCVGGPYRHCTPTTCLWQGALSPLPQALIPPRRKQRGSLSVFREPVEIGLVESLPRPGRNFTGLTTINRELMAKRLEVLKETLPGLTRVGYLANPGYAVHAAQLTEMEAAARDLGLTLHLVEVRAPAEFEEAFARLAAAHVGAFIVQQDHLFVSNRALVIDVATQHRLPGMYVFSLYPRSGGFMSYGAKAEDLCRRAADYVDRILKGTKPSDLPVERPMNFELVINLKTAQALGITIPSMLLFQAEEVIR